MYNISITEVRSILFFCALPETKEKKLKVILCLDDRGGMTFNKRRQSRDRVVTEDIIKSASGGRLVIAPFSEKLFPEGTALTVLDNPLREALSDDSVFLEYGGLSGYENRVTGIIIYRWNKLYPSDTKIDILPEELGLKRVSTEEFAGYSHEKITKETYSV